MPDLPADRRGPAIFGYLGVAAHERVPEAAMDALAAPIRAYLLPATAGATPAPRATA